MTLANFGYPVPIFWFFLIPNDFDFFSFFLTFFFTSQSVTWWMLFQSVTWAYLVKVIPESVVITKLDIYVYTIVILNFHYMYID